MILLFVTPTAHAVSCVWVSLFFTVAPPSPPCQKASIYYVGGFFPNLKSHVKYYMTREFSHYVIQKACALQEPGRAEADFGRYDVKRVVRTIYILFSRSEIPIAQEDQEIMDLADLSTPLPEWFTEEDLAVYTSLYEKSGFVYPLQMPYR